MQVLVSDKVFEALDVSRETTESLKSYLNSLLEWSEKINLVGPATLDDPWTRHIVDSAQLLLVPHEMGASWCDLGSGAGLPGLVLAIVLREKSPETRVTLIESDGRKAAFLKMMVREHGLTSEIIRDRIERAPPAQAGIVTARALAPLPRLLDYVHRHIGDNGIALLPKGRNYVAEVESARAVWHFELDVRESLIDPEAKILRLSHLQKRAPRV